jgi:putative hydrolase of HD superfamily
MKNNFTEDDTEVLLDFLLEVGELKGKKRRGWEFHKIKNSETTAEHIYHLAFLVWIFGRKKRFNLNKAIKMAMIHDLCEIYSPDFTSFDAVAVKEKGKITMKDILSLKPKEGRPTNIQRKRLEKFKRILETKAMKRILKNLPPEFKKEIMNLWMEYENKTTPEGIFVRQTDRVINLLQGLIYWKKYGRIKHKLWVRRIKEVIDDPELLKLIKVIEEKFCTECE